MALPIRRPMNDYAMGPFEIADVDTASAAVYMQPTPHAGQIVGMKLVSATTGSAVNVITVEKNGSVMAGITMSFGVSDAKSVHEAEFSPNLTTGYVEEGDCIQVKTDGGADDGGKASVYLIIRR